MHVIIIQKKHNTVYNLYLLCSSQTLYRISRKDWNAGKTHIFDVQTVPGIEPIFLLKSILKVLLLLIRQFSLVDSTIFYFIIINNI